MYLIGILLILGEFLEFLDHSGPIYERDVSTGEER